MFVETWFPPHAPDNPPDITKLIEIRNKLNRDRDVVFTLRFLNNALARSPRRIKPDKTVSVLD
jgi:hypothetical protein